MLLYVFVYAREILLIKHAEFNLLCLRGDNEVERIAQDRRVGYAIYGGEIKKGQRFLEAIDDADGCEEEVAWSRGLVVVSLNVIP